MQADAMATAITAAQATMIRMSSSGTPATNITMHSNDNHKNDVQTQAPKFNGVKAIFLFSCGENEDLFRQYWMRRNVGYEC